MEENSEQILDIKRKFKLSTQLARLLALLLHQPIVKPEDLKPLFSTYHGDDPYHNADRMILYRLRSRMANIKICIFSQYGEGYYLKAADKAYLRGILEGVIEA